MISSYVYKNRYISYMINDNEYEINISGLNHTIVCNLETTPFKDVDFEIACQMHIDMLCDELNKAEEEQRLKEEELNRDPTQEEIQAEILLNQAEILSNQSSQDEVLAELLLNSLEVSTNV